MTASGSSHNLEVGLRIDQGFDAIAQYAIIFYEEDFYPFHTFDPSLICQRLQSRHKRFNIIWEIWSASATCSINKEDRAENDPLKEPAESSERTRGQWRPTSGQAPKPAGRKRTRPGRYLCMAGGCTERSPRNTSDTLLHPMDSPVPFRSQPAEASPRPAVCAVTKTRGLLCGSLHRMRG
jgi:hypothetical protein